MSEAGGRPRFRASDAEELARRLFGVRARAHELPSYFDRNFRLGGDDGAGHVLKIARADETRELLEAENRAMLHLAAAGIPVARVHENREGSRVSSARGSDGAEHLVRMLDWLPGTVMAEVAARPPALLEDLGCVLGRMDRALAGFSDPATRRRLSWDLENAADNRALLDCLRDGSRREQVRQRLERFERRVLPALRAARHAVIHNDANDHNLLVDEGAGGPRVCGIIDFGDIVHTAVVCEPAIAMAYAMLRASDPVGEVLPLLRGYHRVHPLQDAEIELLLDLIITRLCVSVTLCARDKERDPENEYLDVTRAHAWELLDRLSQVDEREALAAFRGACGREA